MTFLLYSTIFNFFGSNWWYYKLFIISFINHIALQNENVCLISRPNMSLYVFVLPNNFVHTYRNGIHSWLVRVFYYCSKILFWLKFQFSLNVFVLQFIIFYLFSFFVNFNLLYDNFFEFNLSNYWSNNLFIFGLINPFLPNIAT